MTMVSTELSWLPPRASVVLDDDSNIPTWRRDRHVFHPIRMGEPVFVNTFVIHTVRLLNNFYVICEDKLADVHRRIVQADATLSLLEAKLRSVDGLEGTGEHTAQHPELDIALLPGTPESSEPHHSTRSSMTEAELSRVNSNAVLPGLDQPELVKARDDPKYTRLFRMLQVGVPLPHNMNSVFYATTYHPIQAGSIDGTDTASHDNGVYRALVASSTGLYDPTGDPKAEGDPYCTLFVGRLAHHTMEKTLHEVMSKYGRVKRLRLVRHIVTGASRGYAFVEFESEYDMQNAYEVAQHEIIDGSSILVDYNRQQLMPGWIPRRLGGGLGGRKESGQLRFGGRDRPFRAPLRTIPSEQLRKLGIPLPPVGRYMSRFQLPPIPRRPGSSKEGAHHRQRSAYRRSPIHEDERAEKEQRAESSSRQGRRSVGAERESSTHEEHRSRQRADEDADRGYEHEKQHRKRRHSDIEDEHVDREKPSRSSHGDRESSRHRDRDHEYLKEHQKRRPSDQDDDQVEHEQSTTSGHDEKESILHQDEGLEHRKDRKKRSHSEHLGEQADYEKSTRSVHEDKDSSRRHERSRHKHRDSRHHESSASKSKHKDRDGGRDRSTQSRDSTAEHDRPPKHESEQSRHSQSKHRRKDD